MAVRSIHVIGTFMAVVVVFAILVVASRSLGYYRRGRLSVADSEMTGHADVGRSAAIGAGSGLLVLLLMVVLYLGIARWDWLGRPVVSHSGVASPMPVSSPGTGLGVTTSPPTGLATASPSASPTH
jgi:hypothetical protein